MRNQKRFEQARTAELATLKAFYGVGKIGKIRTKRTIEIWYANATTHDRQRNVLNRSINIAYERLQSPDEAEDARHENRVFTAYYLFIDKKPFNGSLEKAIAHNTEVCKEHVSPEVAKDIEEALRKKFYEVFPDHKEPTIKN